MPHSTRTMTSLREGHARRLVPTHGASPAGARSHLAEPERADLHSRHTAFVQLLSDTTTLRDLYAKHAAQASGPLSRVFALICQRHRVEHERLVALLAAHVRTLGGEPLVMAGDIAAMTRIPRPPRAREPMDAQVERLLNAHERIAEQAIALVTSCGNAVMGGAARDDTALIASELILTGKLHVWLLAEHLRHMSNASTMMARAACITGRLVLPFC
ncbi:MAG: ferritin-like domain-containing protein [Phycisphaerales bacterium]